LWGEFFICIGIRGPKRSGFLDKPRPHFSTLSQTEILAEAPVSARSPWEDWLSRGLKEETPDNPIRIEDCNPGRQPNSSGTYIHQKGLSA